MVTDVARNSCNENRNIVFTSAAKRAVNGLFTHDDSKRMWAALFALKNFIDHTVSLCFGGNHPVVAV